MFNVHHRTCATSNMTNLTRLRKSSLFTTLHSFNSLFPGQPGKPAPECQNHSGFYWSKRWRGGSGIRWTICKSFTPRSRWITMPVPHHSFLQAGCSSCRPTNSVKALSSYCYIIWYCRVLSWACLSVCLCLSSCTSQKPRVRISPEFLCSMFLCPWLGPLLAAL